VTMGWTTAKRSLSKRLLNSSSWLSGADAQYLGHVEIAVRPMHTLHTILGSPSSNSTYALETALTAGVFQTRISAKSYQGRESAQYGIGESRPIGEEERDEARLKECQKCGGKWLAAIISEATAKDGLIR